MDRRRMWWIGGAGCAALVVGVVALWPADQAPKLPVRARQYTDVRACLLTDEHGLAGDAAKPVWAGMRDASMKTRVQVSWLSVPAPVTVGSAVPFANTLLEQKCSMVLAASQVSGEALERIAGANPKVRFVVVGSANAAPNLTVLPADSGVRAAVAKVVADAT